MKGLGDLLVAAITRYQAVLGALAALDLAGNLGAGARLPALAAELTAHLAAARESDLALRESLDTTGSSSFHHLPLLREYQDLLQQVAARNQDLLDRARTHLALVGSDLAELKDGKTVLSGYRAPSEQRGRKLSKSC
ncbi:MAG: hypothetical protein L3J03_01565 [Desulfobacterales bacterium]|nr:hypothetical protein [Desulfobacterales bacterium]